MPSERHEDRTGTISVVIPLFNKGPWIAETLGSVLNQTRDPDEIIVVDDGSTDDGVAVAKAIGGSRVRFLQTGTPQSGPSAARNVGIGAARSGWIALLDADDLWSPDFLLRMEECIRDYPDIGCAFSRGTVVGAARSYEHPPRSTGEQTRRLDLAAFLDFWLRASPRGGSPITSSSVVIRKSVLEKAGLFPEAHRRGEDKDTWLRVVAAADAVYLPQSLVTYRRDLPGQLTDLPTDRNPPPLIFTALNLAKSRHSSSHVRAMLRRLANREAWLYAKRRRLRPIDQAVVRAFQPWRNPFRYAALALLSHAGRLLSGLQKS